MIFEQPLQSKPIGDIILMQYLNHFFILIHLFQNSILLLFQFLILTVQLFNLIL